MDLARSWRSRALQTCGAEWHPWNANSLWKSRGLPHPPVSDPSEKLSQICLIPKPVYGVDDLLRFTIALQTLFLV